MIAAIPAALALALAPPQDTPPSAPASAPASRAAEEAPWRVDDPHGPSRTIAFETDEATWLSIDVHPDGSWIVASILGDLYRIPIGGGEARRLTAGAAYDVQPRFSPDGRWIAFASDRGGLENLWVCDLEGGGARQVSSEKGSAVSAPAWSRDGEWILGRKRLTDSSSLGTVELWQWHVRGGQGVQITKKDEQPDAADPAFSPDGRFLYFSARDARFRYARNVNEGIWQLKRLDRRTGQVAPLTDLWGGAAAPAPSPDGKSLAFVRRVRAKTRLELLDLESGATRLLVEGLERDQQEGFAFHGVFPGYAWTPNGREIVATAEGKLWRFDALTGERAPIPFRAAVEQRVTDAVRPGRRLGGEAVRARILRWPVESPDGKTLVFGALGRLWAMDLPGGAPRRVTDFTDLEFCPSFSPDGRRLAFVSWNDDLGGHVWTLSLEPGSAPQRVTRVPAQYANPTFSADGSRLVFLKGSGATFRDGDLDAEMWHEIRWCEAAGGEARYVVSTKNRGVNRRMARPQFSPDGERVFFLEDDAPGKPGEVPKAVFASVKLDGTDRRAHLRFARAGEAVLSPDGRWVAFQEQHEAWVTAFPAGAKDAVEVAAEGSALPLAQLTDEGGEFVAWAGGGRAVAWIHGPRYSRVALDEAMPAPPAADAAKDPKKKKELPKAESIEIRLEVPRAKPNDRTAYVGARVITMRGDEVIERGAVVVDGDRIASVGPADALAIPEGARVVDVSGKTLVPGLFDEHAHLHYSTLDVLPQRPWKYAANLAYGVTSTHDPSASTHEAFTQSEMVEAGLMTGPRIFSTGYILYGADDPARAVVNSLEDARRHLRRMRDLGAFSVKSYMQPKREQRQWILQAARELGMCVVPEGGGDLEMDMTMVLDGHTTIEHALPIAPLRRDVATIFGRSATAYTPTLLVAYGGLFGDLWYYQHYEVWKDEKLLRHVPQGVVDRVARIRSVMAPEEDYHHLAVAAAAKTVRDAGGRVCLGAHGQMQGLGPHWELWALSEGGLGPHEALRAATLAPAEALGLERDLGSLEAGKLADFVVLDRNPLERIQNSDSVSVVVKNGVAYRPEDLARRAPR